MIRREADGARAEQSLGLADAAAQRAVGVGEPSALRVLAGEQDPSADRVAPADSQPAPAPLPLALIRAVAAPIAAIPPALPFWTAGDLIRRCHLLRC